MRRVVVSIASVLFLLVASVGLVLASHSWANYHWARTSNPFNLKLGDNVSSTWDPYLGTTSSDWSLSSVLDTAIVPGLSKGNCRPTKGRVEVCNKTYGNNGWLALAQIWVSGDNIVQGVAKMNDTYFNTTKYNTSGWRNLAMCQEVGHTLGLDHQDEIFNNTNLGTCMDYTDDPDGKLKNQLSNEHPNQHDYDQLDTIYSHLDSTTTLSQSDGSGRGKAGLEDSSEFGKSLKKDGRGKTSLYERDLGKGQKLFTFVIWAE